MIVISSSKWMLCTGTRPTQGELLKVTYIFLLLVSNKSSEDDDDDKGVNDDVQADLRVYSVLSPGSPERKTGGRGFPDTTISCLEDDQHEDRLIVFVEHSLSSSSSSPLLTMARLTWLVQAGWSHDKCSCQNPPRVHSCFLLLTIFTIWPL